MLRSSLFRKYALMFAALVSAALIANGLVELLFSYRETKAALLEIQREKAEAAAAVIEQFVNEMEAQVGWTTHAAFAPGPEGLAARRLDYLRLLRQAPAITEIAYLDGAGHEQLVVSRLAIDVIGSGKDFSADDKFRVARADGRYVSQVYFRKESEPYLTLALAARGRDRGVTVAEVNLKFIWDVVSRIKVGSKGHAYVIDSRGLLIAHPDISLVLRKTDMSSLPQVTAARADARSGPGRTAEAAGGIARDLAGRSVLTADAAIAPLGWLVFVESPLDEAFAPLYDSLTRTAVLLAVGIVLSVAAGLLLARRMVGPIRALRVGAERVASGDFGGRIDVKTGDELEDLAGQFNRMGGHLAESYATLERKVEERTGELSEALQQQTATADVLKVISRSTFDLQTVLDTLTASAARLCDAEMAAITRLKGDACYYATAYGFPAELSDYIKTVPHPPGRGSVIGRTLLAGKSVQVHDILADPEYTYLEVQKRAGYRYRTVLGVPLLREGNPIGVIVLARSIVQPFIEKQIELVTTFADQAVIAIENVRLFEEVRARTRELEESLEQQTASSAILRAIAESTGDIQPVMQVIGENAARLCDASNAGVFRVIDGELHRVASVGAISTQFNLPAVPIDRSSVAGLAVVENRVVQIENFGAHADEFPMVRDAALRIGQGTIVAAPMLREGNVVGVITVVRGAAGPFSPKQIDLLRSFADQAVIAIENARLLDELQTRMRELTETLEQQTATSEILRAIASAPGQAERVLDTICETALRRFGAANVGIRRVEGDVLRYVGSAGPGLEEIRETFPEIPLSGKNVLAFVISTRTQFHFPDVEDVDPDGKYGDIAQLKALTLRSGNRTAAFTPLLREGRAIGVMIVNRARLLPFTEQELEAMTSFADQAVIAIENARLLAELNARMRELSEALEQQTATSAILRAIAKSTGDIAPVMQVISENAARLCDAENAAVFRVQDGKLQYVAAIGPVGTRFYLATIPIDRASVAGQAAFEKRVVQLDDIRAHLDTMPLARDLSEHLAVRTIVGAPMLREGNVVGVIIVARSEVRPFSPQQIDLLTTFADQAVIAIENARLLDELQTRSAELAESVESLEALAAIGQAVSASLDLTRVLDAIAEHAAALAEADVSAIYAFDESAQTFALQAGWRMDPDFIAEINRTPIRFGEGAIGLAAMRGQPVEFADIVAAPGYARRELMVRSGIRALLAVPLARENRVFGALAVMRRTPGEFAPRTVELLSSFASQSALAIQNARLYKEIDEKSRQIELASQHKSQFLANMSHELRTPLNAILGYTELILDELYGTPTQRMREVLERVQVNGRHLLGLINDVLDLSKIEAGQLELSVADFSMKEVIHTVTTATESLATEKGIALDAAVPADLPIGRGDERRLTQVLLNLVGNAIKFTDEGRVGISVAAQNGTFEVAVADTGPGIAASEHERIFEEFHQVDSSSTREKGGTGLGLAIARRIVELHGGRIWVESEPGHGATFRITLPVATTDRVLS